MNFTPGHLYHVYNQGNNRETIFFNRENYTYFLKKVKDFVKPHCHILGWCLMPNHFHFLIGTSEASIIQKQVGNRLLNILSNGFRILETSYAQAINKQENRSGSLFRQRTKAKCLTDEAIQSPNDAYPVDWRNPYPRVCLQYIHLNAYAAGLVSAVEDWEFSSFPDYAGKRNGTLCEVELGKKWIGISDAEILGCASAVIEEEKIKPLFL